MTKKRRIQDSDLEKISGGGESKVFAPDSPGGVPTPGATAPEDPPDGGSPGVDRESDPGGIGDEGAGDLNQS